MKRNGSYIVSLQVSQIFIKTIINEIFLHTLGNGHINKTHFIQKAKFEGNEINGKSSNHILSVT